MIRSQCLFLLFVAALLGIISNVPSRAAFPETLPHNSNSKHHRIHNDDLSDASVTRPYLEWAHSHWVWLHNGANQSQIEQLVRDYLARGIPVGCLNIDSGWSTGFNTFEFNPKAFPDPQGLIDRMHQQAVHVIAWATSFVNTDSPNYASALNRSALLVPDKPLKWWHGKGSLVNYDSAAGLAWWHSQMDKALDMGLDGFKCDASDPYVMLLPQLWLEENWDHYKRQYYSDFFHYTRQKRGTSEPLIMSRPVDCMPAGSGILHFSFSPRDVVFSGWVGDQHANWEGMKVALGNMFRSSEQGYVNFGSDTGGYLTDKDSPPAWGRTKELFIRWTQMSALCPLFENGGGGEHRPWQFDDETRQIYSSFVDLHYQLIPYFYTTGLASFARPKTSAMRPTGDSDYGFRIGSSLFTVPITASNVTVQKVLFPAAQEDDGRTTSPVVWVDWFRRTQTYKTGIHYDQPVSLATAPVYVRAGSLVPMYEGAASWTMLKLVLVRPDVQFDQQSATWTVHRETFDFTVSIVASATESGLGYKFTVAGWQSSPSYSSLSMGTITTNLTACVWTVAGAEHCDAGAISFSD